MLEQNIQTLIWAAPPLVKRFPPHFRSGSHLPFAIRPCATYLVQRCPSRFCKSRNPETPPQCWVEHLWGPSAFSKGAPHTGRRNCFEAVLLPAWSSTALISFVAQEETRAQPERRALNKASGRVSYRGQYFPAVQCRVASHNTWSK